LIVKVVSMLSSKENRDFVDKFIHS
jgi:hypothetical protein